MSHSRVSLPHAFTLVADPPPQLVPRPPQWVNDALSAPPCEVSRIGAIEIVASGSLALLTTSIADARALASDALRERVAHAYVALGGALTAIDRQPIRFWNFVPAPGDAMGGGLDRYMVFNAGRYDGYTQWLSAADAFARTLPAASAVGIATSDLVVSCLASTERGTPVENPRQTPAWRYSRRYGPMPPCFSRATIATLGGRRRLLVAGTASIVGEDSLHEGNAPAQVAETLTNLDALIAAAAASVPDGLAPAAAPLERLRELRVYVAHEEDAAMIRETVTHRCPRAERVELAIARVCRPELLVEIEGIADL